MNHPVRMTIQFLPGLAAAACLLCAQIALAGAPLKGVGVSLGKSPGGGCANRTTDAGGKADFGVWPKGNYTLEFVPAASPATGRTQSPSAAATALPAKLHVVISGTAAGTLVRETGSGLPTGREASSGMPTGREAGSGLPTGRVAPLEFSLDGKQSLVVVITTAD